MGKSRERCWCSTQSLQVSDTTPHAGHDALPSHSHQCCKFQLEIITLSVLQRWLEGAFPPFPSFSHHYHHLWVQLCCLSVGPTHLTLVGPDGEAATPARDASAAPLLSKEEAAAGVWRRPPCRCNVLGMRVQLCCRFRFARWD